MSLLASNKWGVPLFLLYFLLLFSDGASATDWTYNFGYRNGAIVANAEIFATATDSLGNTYLAGYFDGATITFGSITLTKTLSSNRDTFVAKLDASGTVLWAKNFGGSGAYAQGNAIAVDVFGNTYLTGYFNSATMKFGSITLTRIGTRDAFAAKLDVSGAVLWAKNFGGGSADTIGYGIAVDGSGNSYLGGVFQNSNLTTPDLTKIGTSDAFALKLDSAGSITWSTNFGGSGAYTAGYGIAVDASGNSYIGGDFASANLTTPPLTKIGSRDAFVLKLDSSGAPTWSKNVGGSLANTFGKTIAVDASGNVYLGGYFREGDLTNPPLTKFGTSDAFALKLDINGVFIWTRNFGGSGANTEGYCMAVDGSENVYLGGMFHSANLVTPAITKIGNMDAFALKLDNTGSTIWAKNFSGSGAMASGQGISVNSSGNIYLGGAFHESNLTTPPLTLIGIIDAFIIASRTDFNAPTITLTFTPLNYSNQASGTIAFTANEAASFECKVDSGTFTSCTSPYSYNGLANGQHTVTIKATDGAGNTSTSTHTWRVNTALAASSAILLPQTGQAKCYDAAGTEDEDCSEITSKGQDGDIQAGVPWPNPRFTDNGDGTVTDNLTGLQWSKDANLSEGKNWQESLNYIIAMNSANADSGTFGHTDWRLPNISELRSIINLQDTNSWLIAQSFKNIQTLYWSSNTIANSNIYTHGAWGVNFLSGDVSLFDKTGMNYLWPVRNVATVSTLANTGQNICYDLSDIATPCLNTKQDGELQTGIVWPAPRFSNTGSSFIVDALTGLTWAANANLTNGTKTWQESIDFINLLNSQRWLGHNDWRLPNRNELKSLINIGQTNNATWLASNNFYNVQSNSYWTSNSVSVYLSRHIAWLVDMNGTEFSDPKSKTYSVWPVRGGYIAPRLNITKSGLGTVAASTGTLTWNTDNSYGTAYYEMGANTIVTLTSTPGASNLATLWTGCDSFNGNSCSVTMSTKKNITATFYDPPPTAPTNIETQTPTIAGQLVTTWTKPTDSDFSHIHIYRSTTSGTLGTLIGDNQTGIKYADTGLASQTKYYYTVRSVDTTGNESTNTAQVSGTTLYVDTTPPITITGAVATDAATGGRINLSWNASPESDVSFYRVYRRLSSGIFYNLLVSNITGTTYSDTGLTNGLTYYYSITAVDTVGNESVQSNTGHVYVFATPTAPDITPPASLIDCSTTISQPSPKTGTIISHNWAKPVDADFAKLRIYASTASGTLGTKVYEGSGITFEHSGLTAGVTYYYTYRSVDAYSNETTNTIQCSIMTVDEVAPYCPTALTATVLNNTVTLNWTRSGSADVTSYKVYGDNGSGNINYATALASFNQDALTTAFTWTSGTLTAGSTYRYTIRAEDGVFPTPNTATGCGIATAVIPLPAPACDTSVSIKNPHTGKKLGGNSVNVMAEVISGSDANIKEVLFQYREAGAPDWLTIPPRKAQFPNPDKGKPWFVLWDIDGMPNKDYDIRALVTCADTKLPDPTPGYITVTIDQAHAEETCNDDAGTSSGIHLIAPSSTSKCDAGTGGATTLRLPANALNESTTVVISDVTGTPPAGYDGIGVYRDISFGNSQHLLTKGKSATLEISYKDDDNDGIVDDTDIRAVELQLCDYDGETWTCLDSVVDTVNKKVRANTDRFSTYALFVPPKPLETGWNLVSVPLTPIPAIASNIFGAIAYSYNTNTGLYPIAPTVEPGKAYWVRNGFSSIKATGTETPETNFSIPIVKGWNLIGNPFRYKINVSDLKITNGTTETISTAETNGWVIGTLFNYQNGSYLMSTWQDNGTFDPWKGYWILSDINGTLTVPNKPIQ